MRRQYRSPSEHRLSIYNEVQDKSSSQYDLNRNNFDEENYIGSPRLMKTPRRQSYISTSLIPNLSFYEQNNDLGNGFDQPYNGNSLNGVCSECGEYRHMVQCLSHCNLILCESCKSQHWHEEISDLMNIKVRLEDNVTSIRKYLVSKKQQCNENIKSGEQIKKFIAMTMQQIKRKIELELENKRDELYETIDSFVENQKKISQSINEEGLSNSDRINQEIDNILLSTGDEMNFFKVKTIKGLAKLQVERLEKQNSKKIPFYGILFLPDSTIQIQNSFGKILLKSYEDEDFESDLTQPKPNFRDENKLLKNKKIDHVKNMQKWNSSDSVDSFSKTAKAKNLNTEGPNIRKSSNYTYYYEDRKDTGSPTPDATLLSTPNVSPRTVSQPAPLTRLKLPPADPLLLRPSSNDHSAKSGHSSTSTDEYFNSFKAPISTQVKDSDEDDIVSI